VTFTGTPAKDGFLNGGVPFAGPGNLDEEIGPLRLSVETNGLFDGVGCIVRQRRRYLQRHPAIHAGGGVVDRPKEIGCLPQILDRKLEEEGFT
jgi:hypothetical protein